ncbi:uncharacterized protein YALI1_E13453g [Yarrowia lipolytica]|uniref:Uncharacterized protein n=1 Tax=Yarrowia lipolytica TaxID=4952 RepID=A0A1D8NI13_YARLL|nr:hypothetical protein YALI1_E13453g [Yarrowia lipolytica]
MVASQQLLGFYLAVSRQLALWGGSGIVALALCSVSQRSNWWLWLDGIWRLALAACSCVLHKARRRALAFQPALDTSLLAHSMFQRMAVSRFIDSVTSGQPVGLIDSWLRRLHSWAHACVSTRHCSQGIGS